MAKYSETDAESSGWILTGDQHVKSSHLSNFNSSGKEPTENNEDISQSESPTPCQDTDTTPTSSESHSTNTSGKISGYQEKQVSDDVPLPLTYDKNVTNQTIVDLSDHDPYTINILLIGRSQVGKSTLIESLNDRKYSSSRTGISQTREPTYKQLKMRSDDGEEYTLNIIDTPGLREIRNDPNETRTDEQLLQLLRRVFDDGHIRTLNMIGFVSVMGKTYQNDIETFKSLIDFLGERFRKISALILTHCDKVSNERIQLLTEELKTHPNCKEAISYCQLGVYHHGTLDIDDLETFEDKQIRERISEQVLSHLETLRTKFKTFLLSQSGHYEEITDKDFTRFSELIDAEKGNISSDSWWRLPSLLCKRPQFIARCSIL